MPHPTQLADAVAVSNAVARIGPDVFAESRPIEPIDLVAKLEELISGLAPQTHALGLEIVLRIAPLVPRHITDDPEPVLDVLERLVKLAIRQTRKGEVVLSVLPATAAATSPFEEEGDEEDQPLPPGWHPAPFHFEVRDTSPQLAGADGEEHFAEVSRLLQKMGGELSIRRTASQGRACSFELPCTPAVSPSSNRQEVGNGVRGAFVLVVDNNEMSRTVLEEILAGWGISCHVVDCGGAALAAVRRFQTLDRPFDALVIDARMPQMSGFDLAKTLVKDPTLSRPVVLLTPVPSRAGDEAFCRRLGVAARVAKPVRRAELLEGLGIALATRATESAAAEGVSPPCSQLAPAPEIAIFEEAEALARLDGDAELLREMASLFANDYDSLWGHCKDAMRAGDSKQLWQAVSDVKAAVAMLAAAPILKVLDQLLDFSFRGQLTPASQALMELGRQLARLRSAVRAIL